VTKCCAEGPEERYHIRRQNFREDVIKVERLTERERERESIRCMTPRASLPKSL